MLRNIQLWDTDVLRPQIDQQQSIGSYYAFPGTTVDRYRQGSRARAMIVAQRELDLHRLDPSGRTWANDHLAYTHGYGLVAAPPVGSVPPASRSSSRPSSAPGVRPHGFASRGCTTASSLAERSHG